MQMRPVAIAQGTAVGVEVELPRTHLVVVTTDKGFLMCGALDVALLSTKLRQREIVAGRAVGVRTIDELLAAPLESVTPAAEALGVTVGMRGSDAIARML